MCFLVCYLPGGILRLIFVVQSLTPGLFDVLPRTPAGRDRFFYVYMALNLMLISLNSMLNPLVLIPSTAANRERRVRRQNIFRRDTMSNNCNWHEIGAMQYFVCVWRSLNVFVLKRTTKLFWIAILFAGRAWMEQRINHKVHNIIYDITDKTEFQYPKTIYLILILSECSAKLKILKLIL